MSLALKEVIRIGEKMLLDAGVSDAAIDARELYCFMEGLDRTGLMMAWQKILQDNQCEAYFSLVEKRASRVPLQHITGMQEFMGLPFKVNEDVLIPRQDTETMVEDAIELLNKGTLRGNPYADKKAFRGSVDVLDLCCGSGAIGISVSKLVSSAKVTCADISPQALAVAKENAAKNKCKGIRFIESDLFAASEFHGHFGKGKYQLILSNPPYIEHEVIAGLEPEVRDHEPALALDGGADGLDFYRKIVKEAPQHLKKKGILMMEIGYNQKEAVKELLRADGRFEKIVGLTDLTGKDRIIAATAVSGKQE